MLDKTSEINTRTGKSKCNFKCNTCHYYSKENDSCEEKGFENISEYVNTDFSQCDSYLVNSKLIMF